LKELFGEKGSHGGKCVLRKANVENTWRNIEISPMTPTFSLVGDPVQPLVRDVCTQYVPRNPASDHKSREEYLESYRQSGLLTFMCKFSRSS